jgi:signal transduction histidine kinase/ligand-binding sensor domain-containing protein
MQYFNYRYLRTMPRLHSLLVFLFLPMMLFGQETLRVKDYGVDQGLPQSTVWDILQDDFGFLWVGTADGLCRFDGYSFSTYRTNPLDSLSIGGNTTHHLAVDSKGDLWLTHDQGFDKYDAAKGSFSSLFRYDALRTNVFNETIGEDKKGFVWAWIGGEGLLKFDRTTNRNAGKYTMEGTDAWRNDDYCRDGLVDSKGQIWMIQRNGTLISFNTANDKFKVVDVGMELGALCIANDSVLLMGAKKGLIRYNTLLDKSETIFFKSAGSENFQATRIIRVSADEYWVGTSKGIFVYNDKLRTFSKHYTSCSGGKENFLFVQSMFMDRSGNIWIGTNGDGLKKYSPKAVPWKLYQSTSDRGDIVKAIYSNANDLVFVGYYDNGLDVFSKTKGFIRKIRKDNVPNRILNDMVYAISGIRKSELFISFSGGNNAFGIYDYKKQKFQDLSSGILKLLASTIPAGNPYPAITPVGVDSILFNYRDALVLGKFMDDNDPEFILLKRFPNDAINSIYKDSKSTIWVGTLNGFYSNQPGSKEWIKGNSLSKQIKTICEDGNGKLWMGTTSGLYIVSKRGEIEKEYKVGYPLVNDYVYGILRDTRGDMWFSHNKGLTRYDYRKNTFRNFTIDDGLQSNEFNTGAYYKSPAGELFFGGIHGVNSFFPDDIKDNLQIPSVQITRIDVHDKPLVSNLVNWAQRTVTLGYTDNTLSFEFAGLEFTEPAKNQYAWRMSGIDHDWVYSGNKRFTRYANIAPGEYSFEVKASNNDGVWNEIPSTISIIIVPPYWQTWWFRLLELTVGAGVVALIAYMISRQRYRKKLQALEVQQKIQQDRGRISRELHDNIGAQLSLISSNLDWIAGGGPVLTDHERKVRISNINELSKEITGDLRETIWALNKEAITFLDLTDRLKRIAQKLVSLRPEVKLIFNDGGTDVVELNPEEALNLLRMCQEAIHNAVKHSEMNTLQIGWKCDSGHYEIFVKDNGHGFANSNNHEDRYGLENVKKRAAEIGAVVAINTNESGTTVTISKK